MHMGLLWHDLWQEEKRIVVVVVSVLRWRGRSSPGPGFFEEVGVVLSVIDFSPLQHAPTLPAFVSADVPLARGCIRAVDPRVNERAHTTAPHGPRLLLGRLRIARRIAVHV